MTPAYRRPYWRVSLNVAIVWWCVSGVTIVAAWAIAPSPLTGLSLGSVVWIALGSGFVAAMAIAPGLIVTVPDFTLSRESPGSASRWSASPGPGDTESVLERPSPTASAQKGPHQRPVEEGASEAVVNSGGGELSQSTAVERIGQAFLAGMLIRLAGTVALFMASSYYLEPSDAESVLASIAGSPTALRIAVWVLGWHAILLLTEVVSLVSEIKQ